jgi:hypothetical protein
VYIKDRFMKQERRNMTTEEKAKEEVREFMIACIPFAFTILIIVICKWVA